jgi:hypothetical protein
MKKFIALSLLTISLFLPLKVQAEEIFGFEDGKFYDINQTLKYICFLDNNCYDLNGTFAFQRSATSAPTTSGFEVECNQPLVALQQRTAEIEAEYLAKWKVITANSEGKFDGAVEQDVDALNRWRSTQLDANRAEIDQLQKVCLSKYPNNY